MPQGQRTLPVGTALLFGEAVTLAHVGRPLAIASLLRQAGWQTTVATSAKYREMVERDGAAFFPITCVDQGAFQARLESGARVLHLPELMAAVREDLKLIDAVRPDIVVGDFRLSLFASARLSRVPYLNVSNAYWHPAVMRPVPLPEIPLRKFAGRGLGSILLRGVWPVASRIHAAPLIQLARHFGIPPPAPDVGTAYTESDCTLFCDLPSLYRGVPSSDRQRYVGPMSWSPGRPDGPDPWDSAEGNDNAARIYVSLGSSGSADTTNLVLDALTNQGFRLLVSRAGKVLSPRYGEVPWVQDFVDGDRACAQADLVVCNGGSPGAFQALTHGVPVLGMPRNMDQFLNMRVVEQSGAGQTCAVSTAPGSLRATVIRMLSDPALRTSARLIAAEAKAFDALESLRDAVATVIRGARASNSLIAGP